MNKKRVYATLITVTAGFLAFDAHAATNAQTTTVKGVLTDSSGTAPLLDTVDLVFSIYDKGGTCILYEETDTLDLTTTNGFFSVQVGSLTGASKRTSNDPGLAMADIFANHGTLTGHASCSYTPAAGDYRNVRITVTPHLTMTATTLTPDVQLDSTPQAWAAENLQGFVPSDFIQSAAGVAGQANVNLANLQTLTGGADASSLHNHDLRYVQLGGGTAQNLGSGGMITTGTVGIGTAVSPTATELQIVTTGSSTIGEVIKGSSTQTADLLQIQNFSGTPIFQVDASGNVKTSVSTPATSGTNYSSNTLSLNGNYWTGSTSSADSWNFASSLGTGSNPTSTLTLSHAGSTGASSFSVPSANVGVGTVNPGAKLEVDGTSGTTLKIVDGNQGTGKILTSDANGVASWSTPSGGGNFMANGSVPMTGALQMGGNTVNGNSTATGSLTLDSTSNATKGFVNINPSGGSVGIGTTTPGSTLQVNGTVGVGGAAGVGVQFQSTAAGATNIGAVIKGAASQSADLFEIQDNTATILTKIDSTGMLTLKGAPTANLQAATKQYVDTAVASVSAGSLIGTVGVANGGTGLTNGIAGGIPFYSTTGIMASSGVLSQYQVVLGGGPGSAPTVVGGGSVGQVLTNNGAGAPSWQSISTFNSPAFFQTGTANNPSIAFSGDTQTGLFDDSGNSIGFTSQGIQIAAFGGGRATFYGPTLVYGSDSTPYNATSGSVSAPSTNIAFNANNTVSQDGVGVFNSLGVHNASGVPQSAYVGAISNTGGSTYTPSIVIGQQTGAVAYSERMRIDKSGNIGIGTTTPRAALEVHGAVVSTDPASAGTTVDFSTGNLQFTTGNCSTFNFNNLKSGGTYSFVVKGTTSAMCNLSMYSDAGITSLTSHFNPVISATISGKQTVYKMIVVGTDVYVDWVSNY